MPTYDYLCESNGEIVEVKHRMSESISTWGELCDKAGIPLGDTQADSPVKKLATGGQVVKGSALKDSVPPCSSGGGCPSGGCGF